MPDPIYSQDPVAQAVEIALLKALVEQQGKQILALQEAITTLTSKVDAINQQMAEARGGWRAIAFVGGFGATIGGFISWALQHLKVSP